MIGFFGKKEKKSPANEFNEQMAQPAPAPKPKVESVQDVIKTPSHNVSILNSALKVKANIKGEGSLIIGGSFDGEIEIADTVFIEKGAKVEGVIKAKNVKVSGEFLGTIYANAAEITKSGKLSGVIHSNKAFLGGEVSGTIRSVDSIEITKDGIVEAKECRSKKIKIVGKVKGKVIASELLEVVNTGFIEGTIITKGIRTEQGGSIIGNIQTYDSALDNESHFFEEEKKEDDLSKMINLDAKDMQKYAKKEPKRISAQEKSE